MGIKVCRRVISALALLCLALPFPAFGQESKSDSLVRLMQATSLELIEQDGITYRKTVDATFLHNGTYLVCDTALWNVDTKIINAWGNVKLIQEETVLTSASLDYIIDSDMAEFRGDLVQLRNKDDNVLRSTNLDYNTKDSVAVFRDGGSMKSKDGQIIESLSGIYDSRTKIFDFNDKVNVYMDSVFMKTSHLVYDSGQDKVLFTSYMDFWNDEKNMLSAGGGWYDRVREIFFFNLDVHGLTDRQECWSDSLYIYRNSKDVLMLGNAQISDTSRHVTAMADYIYYSDTLSQVTMKRQAAVALSTSDKGKTDTLYAGADTLVLRAVRMCDIPEGIFAESKKRLDNMNFDAVAEFRKKAAEAAAKAKEEEQKKAMENDPNAPPHMASKAEETAEQEKAETESSEPEAPVQESVRDSIPVRDSQAQPDSLSVRDSLSLPDSLQVRDSLSVGDSLSVRDSLALADSLAVAQDTLPPLDTTKINFITGIGNVRVFRKDIQLRCDSLNYCDLDSIARFFKDPIVWNEGNRQYTSDSLYVLVRNGGMDRASLMGNAFIITREDSLCYDQIKGSEVVAYFDSTSALRRFDALGGAAALFYLKENEVLATVNKVESKMLSANMVDGNLDRVYYYESPKNDAYPVAQMKDKDRVMKGFAWNADKRPTGPESITELKLMASARDYYEGRPKAEFRQTDRFFPGYMEEVYKALREARIRKNTPPPPPELADSLSLVADSLSLAAAADSLSAALRSDSLSVAADSVVHSAADSLEKDSILPAAEMAALAVAPTKKELREEARKLAIARRDAKWAEQDAKEAAKAAAKEQKKLEKQRRRTMAALLRKQKQDAKDDARREKYRLRYEKRKAREDARAKKHPVTEKINETELESAGERASEIEHRGDLQAPAAPVLQTP